MAKPAFIRTPPPPSPTGARHVRCRSYALAAQGAAWRYTLLHDRTDNLLLWVTRGQGRVIVNGIRRGLSMHNALYLPAGTLFSFDLPLGVQALLVESPAGLTGRLPREALHLRVRDSLAQAELTATIDAISRELREDRPYLQDALEAHVRLIAVWLQRQQAGGAADRPPETASQRLVRRYAQAITRGFRAPQSMGDHAALLDVTPTHLSRVCRQACGKTAAEMLVERKLHAARTELEAPSPAIRKVAEGLGFASAAYFTRFVQSHTGSTPSQLRDAAQSAPARRP